MQLLPKLIVFIPKVDIIITFCFLRDKKVAAFCRMGFCQDNLATMRMCTNET